MELYTDEEQALRARAIQDAHAEWAAEQLAAGVDGPTPPDHPDDSDWNQHAPDMLADGMALDRLETMTQLALAQAGALPLLTAAADISNGAMVAYVPAAEDAHRLALLDPDAEPVDQLHVTSIYLGDATDWDETDRSRVIDMVTELARGWAPIAAQAFGLSVLNPKGEEPCLVLNVGGQELADRQAELVALDVAAPDQHAPWLAHLTLAYHPDPRTLLTDEVLARTGPVQLDRIRVAFGGVATDIPLVTGLTADAGVTVFRTYTRDSHGQFSSSGGVRDSFARAQTNDELSAAFDDEFHRTTGRHIHSDFGSMDTERAAGHAEGIMRGVERYPNNGLTEVGVYSRERAAPGFSRMDNVLSRDAYAITSHDGHGIYFNEGISSADLHQQLHEDMLAGRLTAPSFIGVGAHEMGHVVTAQNDSARIQGYVAMQKLNTRRNETPTKFVTRTIGVYATQNDHEMASEALADVLVNSHPSPVSKAIVAAMDANIPGAKP